MTTYVLELEIVKIRLELWIYPGGKRQQGLAPDLECKSRTGVLRSSLLTNASSFPRGFQLVLNLAIVAL